MRNDLEQYLLKGEDIGMPVIEHCGYEIAHGVRRLEPHHHSGPEVVCLLEGEMRWGFSDGNSLFQRGGMIHFLRPGVDHFPYNSKQTPCHQVWIVLKSSDGISLKGTVFEPGEFSAVCRRISELSGTAGHMSKRLTGDVVEFSRLAMGFKSGQDPLLKPRLRTLICEILLGAAMRSDVSVPSDASEKEIIRRAKEYLDRNLSRQVDMDAMAEYLGYSGTWVMKIFRNAVGVPPAQYLRRKRIEMAQRLLQDGKLSITDIAFRCGFNSSQHFSQVFRKYTGQSPSQARGN